MNSVILNKHDLMLSNAGLNSDYYLTGNKTSNNHDIIFLTGLMLIVAVVILAFVAIRFTNLAISPESVTPINNNQSVTYSDIYV